MQKQKVIPINKIAWSSYGIMILLFTLSGCATSSNSVIPPAIGSLPSIAPEIPKGIYHRVEKGQTLWRIARMYGVSVEELAKVNRLPDATKVKNGQLIFIPGALQPRNSLEISTEDFVWPVKGKILSYFGAHQDQSVNKGIDIGSAAGTPVKAARSGKVIFVQEKFKGLGKTLILEHEDGYQTVYGHLSEILVQPGELISQEMVIARTGNTGRTTLSELHFQIRKNQKPQNPLHYLP